MLEVQCSVMVDGIPRKIWIEVPNESELLLGGFVVQSALPLPRYRRRRHHTWPGDQRRWSSWWRQVLAVKVDRCKVVKLVVMLIGRVGGIAFVEGVEFVLQVMFLVAVAAPVRDVTVGT